MKSFKKLVFFCFYAVITPALFLFLSSCQIEETKDILRFNGNNIHEFTCKTRVKLKISGGRKGSYRGKGVEDGYFNPSKVNCASSYIFYKGNDGKNKKELVKIEGLKVEDTCKKCQGYYMVTCEYCNGNATKPCKNCQGRKVVKDKVICPECKGKGVHYKYARLGKIKCKKCNGYKTITSPNVPCWYCKGCGEEILCSHCRGKGKVDCPECGK